MPIRCTVKDVKEICDIDTESFPDTPGNLTPFIRIASSLVDSFCTTSGYSDAQLKDIEVWLSAHFYHILDPQLVREEVSTLRKVYQQQVDLGLNFTAYGQQVKLLDYMGNLAALDVRIKKGASKASISWLGKDK